MTESRQTPCGALFAVMKRFGGMSYKELAGLILSGKPLADGRSPVSRVSDRTWVSRFVVHAPVGTLQERYFCDFGTSALRIIARLKARERRAMTSEQILSFIMGEGGELMKQALLAAHQDISLYDNVLARLIGAAGYADSERVEIAMILFVAAGCTANVRRAAEHAVDYARLIHGDGLATTPVSVLGVDKEAGLGTDGAEEPYALGLMRVVNGYVKGDPSWVMPDGDGAEIGALALGEHDIADVGRDVSGRHAHVWCDGNGHWFVEDLGSRNGTAVISGIDGGKTVVAPPRDEAKMGASFEDSEESDARRPRDEVRPDAAIDSSEHVDARIAVSGPVEIHPGDELVLAGNTVFALVAGIPE